MATPEELLQLYMLRHPEAAKGGFHSLMSQAIPAQNESFRRQMQTPDTAALERAAALRAMRGQDQMAAGMAMATAVPQFHPMAQQSFRAGQAAQEPSEMGEGVYTPGLGYTADPFKAQARLSKALAGQAGAGAQFAGAYGTQENQEAQRENQRLSLEEQRRHARVIEGTAGGHLALARQKETREAEMGRVLKVQDAAGNEQLVRITPTGYELVGPSPGAGSAGGGSTTPGIARYPATQSPKATEGERNTGYQLESVLSSAPTAFTPGAAQQPGSLEALARTVLPKEIGEGVASFLSSSPRQIARASQESIVDSLLWLSTGAAYNDPQFQQKKREVMIGYFDKPDTVAFKHAKIAELAVAARNRAGRAWTQAQEDKLLAAFPMLAEGSPLARFNPATASAPGAAPAAPGQPARVGDPYLRKQPR